MSSLYNIEQNLIDLFETIEDQEGEVTDEQYNFLTIKEEELKEKLNNYCKAVQSWNSDSGVCKAEEKRIKLRRAVFDNRVKRLKEAMLQAVQLFGNEGKTNKFIELEQFRVSTRKSVCTEIDEVRLNVLITELKRYLYELVKQGILYTGDDVDLQGILDCINTNCIAEEGEGFEPFTIDDLNNIKIEVSNETSIADLFLDEHIIKSFAESDCAEIRPVLSSTDYKEILKNHNLTVARLKNNESLIIK